MPTDVTIEDLQACSAAAAINISRRRIIRMLVIMLLVRVIVIMLVIMLVIRMLVIMLLVRVIVVFLSSSKHYQCHHLSFSHVRMINLVPMYSSYVGSDDIDRRHCHHCC